jgi:hypothetical protein
MYSKGNPKGLVVVVVVNATENIAQTCYQCN